MKKIYVKDGIRNTDACDILACMNPVSKISICMEASVPTNNGVSIKMVCLCQEHAGWSAHLAIPLGGFKQEFSINEYEVYKVMSE